MNPRVASINPLCQRFIVVPCKDEAHDLPLFLGSLRESLDLAHAPGETETILVDNGSCDESARVAQNCGLGQHPLRVIAEFRPGCGHALAAGADLVVNLMNKGTQDSIRQLWLIALDADTIVPPPWMSVWRSEIAAGGVSFLSGRSVFGMAFAQDFPIAAKLLIEMDDFACAIERVVGVVNIEGPNHGCELSAYQRCGGWQQPSRIRPDGCEELLAGADWDLGVRALILGERIRSAAPYVFCSDRRARANVTDYVTGACYEQGHYRAAVSVPGADIPCEVVHAVRRQCELRAVKHFLLKPLLARSDILMTDALAELLGPSLQQELGLWIAAHRVPDFFTDRNAFILETLETAQYEFGERIWETARSNLVALMPDSGSNRARRYGDFSATTPT